jgi:imidazolonepropionase-like amidohydrolase
MTHIRQVTDEGGVLDMGNSTQPLMVDRASVFDGTGTGLRHDWSLIADAGKIAWLGPADQAPTFDNGRKVDGAGCTVLAGLVDSHVHLCADGGPDFIGQLSTDSVQRATLRAARNARHWLETGVTTLRDCGSANDVAIELSHAIADGLLTGPRILAAGRVITMTGGHCYFIGRESDGPDGVRASVRKEIKAGADFIKVMATGGVLTPGVATGQVALTEPELRVIVEEAHNAGKRVTAHAIGNEGIKNALRAGVDAIEHGMHLDDEALDLAISNGTFLVPTLLALEVDLDPAHRELIPEWVYEKAVREADFHHDSFKAAVKSGMKIGAGTDAGTPFNPHGGLVDELESMIRLGLSAEDALIAATIGAAGNIGLGHAVGTLEIGKDADLLMVRGDPTADIAALREVAMVARAGDVVHVG